MNAQQMAFFMMILVYVSTLLAPNFLPKSIPFIGFLADIGLLGITIFCMTALMIIPFKGAPMMDFKNIAKKSFNWDIFFLVAAATYSCNAMTDESTGIKPFLIELLQPLLGGKSDLVFVALLLAFALITTNFANNAGMAVVLIPVVMAFADCRFNGTLYVNLYDGFCGFIDAGCFTLLWYAACAKRYGGV